MCCRKNQLCLNIFMLHKTEHPTKVFDMQLTTQSEEIMYNILGYWLLKSFIMIVVVAWFLLRRLRSFSIAFLFNLIYFFSIHWFRILKIYVWVAVWHVPFEMIILNLEWKGKIIIELCTRNQYCTFYWLKWWMLIEIMEWHPFRVAAHTTHTSNTPPSLSLSHLFKRNTHRNSRVCGVMRFAWSTTPAA